MNVADTLMERIDETQSFNEFVFSMSDLIIKLSNIEEGPLANSNTTIMRSIAGLMCGIAPIAANKDWDYCKDLLRETYEASKTTGPVQ